MINDLILALTWYMILTCFGIIVLPISMKVFRRMPEGGILLARPLGWLLLGAISWMAAYFIKLPFSILGILTIAILLFALSAFFMVLNPTWLNRKFLQCWRTAVNGEIITILVFLLIVFARREDPNIDSTEKPMDAMILNALAVTKVIPPPDPWLHGFDINYHYGGYLLHSLPIKLSGIYTEYAYNLSIATIAAMAAAVAFVLGRTLFGRCRWTVLTVVCTLFIGNLASFTTLFSMEQYPKTLYELRYSYLWNTSRVIHDQGQETINEYPFFSIVWGDLHPHYSNIPFFLLFLALCYALYHAFIRLSFGHLLRYEWPLLATLALSFAFLIPTNIFDVPSTGIFFGALMLTGIIITTKKESINITQLVLKFSILVIPIIGYLLAAPFWFNFESPIQKDILQWSGLHTNLWEFILVFGAPLIGSLVVINVFVMDLLKRWKSEVIGFGSALFGIVFMVLWGISGNVTYALAPLLALLFWFMVLMKSLEGDSTPRSINMIFAGIACALAWSAIAGCEYIYLQDTYASKRMNTLFKFHFTAWLLFGIGLPYLAVNGLKQIKEQTHRVFLLVPLIAVFVVSLSAPLFTFFTLFSLPTQNRFITLDGLAFMKAHFPMQYEVIDYVRKNTEPTDLIAEIPGGAYSLENAVSAFTGRPTLVGWVNHEGLWRGRVEQTDDPKQKYIRAEVHRRKQEMIDFYTTQNWEEAKQIIKKNGIQYVSYSAIAPGHTDLTRHARAIQQGVIRQHLEPIIGPQTGNIVYGLFKVSNHLLVENQ